MMKTSLYTSNIIFLIVAFSYAQSDNDKTDVMSNIYFPVNNNKTLVYESSFGESFTRYFMEDESTISSSEADNFKYKQTLIIKEDGVYTKETYQYLKIFLFIKKEGTFTYSKPLLRFPLPLLPGSKWSIEGDEYSDGEINKVKVTGKASDKEFITTKGGRFEAIKIESIIEGSSNSKNRVTEWYAEGIGLIKAKIVIEGGGVMGVLRDILGYGTIEFELKEIRTE